MPDFANRVIITQRVSSTRHHFNTQRLTNTAARIKLRDKMPTEYQYQPTPYARTSRNKTSSQHPAHRPPIDRKPFHHHILRKNTATSVPRRCGHHLTSPHSPPAAADVTCQKKTEKRKTTTTHVDKKSGTSAVHTDGHFSLAKPPNSHAAFVEKQGFHFTAQNHTELSTTLPACPCPCPFVI